MNATIEQLNQQYIDDLATHNRMKAEIELFPAGSTAKVFQKEMINYTADELVRLVCKIDVLKEQPIKRPFWSNLFQK